MKGVKSIVFRVHEQSFGVDISLISGIEREQLVVPIPNAPSCIKGIINLRGEIVPVYSLCRKFNAPELTGTEVQLIIINRGEMHIALEVEAVEEIIDIAGEKISEPPAIIKSNLTSYLDSIAKQSNKLIIMLNVERLITEEEAEDIENFVEKQKGQS